MQYWCLLSMYSLGHILNRNLFLKSKLIKYNYIVIRIYHKYNILNIHIIFIIIMIIIILPRHSLFHSLNLLFSNSKFIDLW